ncbi:MAG: Wzz/FepE/Etk N-terminal domain-containing protein [Anaerolineae bacterium]|nr:Wzz/FepE/Etk N-terminal domain-containing protein [Anaerolineae bacterium]MDH7474192.1 Wzz/FepE/Etk N-terminal domain-containing protein [Anaerolineae bacterium]
MEDEIDLREYIDVLIRHWKAIVILTVVAAVVSGVVSFLLPPTYEARAMVAAVQPKYVMRFDPRFETLNKQSPVKAYPALATSDDVLSKLITAAGDILDEDEQQVYTLSRMVEAASSSDPSLIALKVKSRDPMKAARLANIWADIVVREVNDLYGQSEEEAQFFEAQVQTAEANLKSAEEALIAYQAANQTNILDTKIAAMQQSLRAYYDAAQAIQLVLQDANNLVARLRLQPSDAPASLGDDLASLFLAVQSLSTKYQLPIELQVDSAQSFSGKTVGEQISFLEDMISTLSDKVTALEAEAEKLKPQILELQEQQQAAKTEYDRLQRNVDTAQEVYLTIVRKAEESRIAAESEGDEMRLASYAAVPTKPVSPKKALNVAVAGTLGLFVGVFGAFAWEYLSSPRPGVETAQKSND